MARYPFHDLREYINTLEEEGMLLRVAEEVDWRLELGAMVRKAADAQGPSLLFEKIKDYSPGFPFFAGTFPSCGALAIALGLSKDSSFSEISLAYRHRLKRPLAPQLVDRHLAPCKENIQKGAQVDVLKFPTPFWHSGDGGRYLGTLACVITRNPDTGLANVGIYRVMIHDQKTLGLHISPGQDGYLNWRKYQEGAQKMPVAISIGQDPVNVLAAYSNWVGCEWEMAGALRGAPVELVKCETVDLEVPATAEIVVEGYVALDEAREEGPFGEYTGFYGTRRPRPVIRVTCVTHRNEPIHTGLLQGKPAHEYNVMSAVQQTAELEKLLKDDLKLEVKSVYAHPWAVHHGIIVSMKPLYPGHVNRVAHAIWAHQGATADYVIVVGDDIDATRLEQVLWAICTRCKPDRGILITTRETAVPLWPCLSPEERRMALGAKVLIDATFPVEWPKEWVPAVADWNDFPEAVRQHVEKNWKHYGIEL